MIQAAPTPKQAATLPPESLYWAVLDPPKGPRGRRRRDQLGFLFESSLPVQIEEVQARFSPLADGRVLACGIEHDRLAAVSVDALQLCPCGIPAFIRSQLDNEEVAVPDPGSFNLLTGAHTPEGVGRLQRALAIVALSVVVLGALLLIVGFERGRVLFGEQARAHQREVDSLYTETFGPRLSGGQHPSAQLLAELRSLRGQTSSAARRDGLSDVSDSLAQILEAWPVEVNARTENLTVGQRSAQISVRLGDAAEAELIEERLGALSGWAPAQRSLRRARDEFVLQLPMTRTEGVRP